MFDNKTMYCLIIKQKNITNHLILFSPANADESLGLRVRA